MMNNLLLVDDDVAVLHFLQSCVADMAELRVARSGTDALRLARQQRPDLVLLDLHLGDTDGLTLLQTLRNDRTLAGVPVIFLSSEPDISPRVRALDLDALDWLAKPLDAQRLRARVQSALRRNPRPPEGVGGVTDDDAGPTAASTLRGACVLAVDDDPVVLESLRQALSPEGFRLLTAASASEAATLAAIEAPEVVLIDVKMPGEDGFSLAHRLMTMPAMADAPLIFVTQHGDVASEVRALGLGAFDFISKPIVPLVLRARVCNALRLRRRSAYAMRRAEMHWRQVGGTQLAAIIAQAQEAIVSIDAAGRVMLANEASYAILGRDGTGDAPLAGTVLPSWLMSVLPEDLLRGDRGSVSNVTLAAPGQPGTVYDIGATILDHDGGRLVTLTFHDQTARQQAEQLARQQLTLEAEGMARKLMLSYLVHEIGNPLNGIIGLTGILLAPGAEPLSPDQRRKLAMVGDSAQVLHRLMRDALDLAQWQVGRFSVEIAAVGVRTVVESTMGSLAEVALRAGVVLADPSGDLDVAVLADPQRLHQCLHNLVSNACKYGRPGGRVQVDIVAGPADVEISVCDDGLGLSPEQMARLFEPFERLGRQGPAGHGLGLAVTRMLAQAMAGRLEVDAEEGVGSRFTIVLPRARD
jgi:DNA-binding response OmpR family regulator/anti-sigma regulatory factor (Ser/Thr protein kinase)